MHVQWVEVKIRFRVVLLPFAVEKEGGVDNLT